MPTEDPPRDPRISRPPAAAEAVDPTRFEPALTGTIRSAETIADLEARNAGLQAKYVDGRFPPDHQYWKDLSRVEAQIAEAAAGLLTAADPDERARAARLIVRLADKAPVAARLAARLVDPIVAAAVADELGELHGVTFPRDCLAPLVPWAAQAIRPPEDELGFRMLVGLAAIDTDIGAALPDVVECLLSDDFDIVGRAMWVLRSCRAPLDFRPQAPRLMEALRKRWFLHELLKEVVPLIGGGSRDIVVPALLSIAAASGPDDRYRIGAALPDVGGRAEGVAMLTQLLFAPDDELRDPRLEPAVRDETLGPAGLRGRVACRLAVIRPEGRNAVRRAAYDPRPEIRAAFSRAAIVEILGELLFAPDDELRTLDPAPDKLRRHVADTLRLYPPEGLGPIDRAELDPRMEVRAAVSLDGVKA